MSVTTDSLTGMTVVQKQYATLAVWCPSPQTLVLTGMVTTDSLTGMTAVQKQYATLAVLCPSPQTQNATLVVLCPSQQTLLQA